MTVLILYGLLNTILQVSLHLILFSFQQLHLLSQPFNDLKLFHLYMLWIMCMMQWLSKILQIHLTLELTPIPYSYGLGFLQAFFVLYALHSYILQQGRLRRTTECFRVSLRGHSQTMFTRRGRQVVQKCPLFINIYTIENVNTGGQVLKEAKILSTQFVNNP